MRQCDECEYYRGGESCGHPSIKIIDMGGVGDTFPWIHETPPWCPIDKDEPQTCGTCKWGEWYRQGYDITMMDDECGGCCSWNSKWTPKDEPQTDCAWK